MRVLLILFMAAAAIADEKQPTPKARGKFHWSRTATGFRYVWRVPKDYRVDRGADLVVYVDHDVRTIQRQIEFIEAPGDAIVVAPVWQKPPRPRPEASRQLHMVLQRMRKTFKVVGTWAVGKSEGASFIAYHAGIRTADFDGFVAVSPHVWKDIKVPGTGKRDTAIALFARTDDSINENQLAYVTELYERYRERGHKHAHLGVWHNNEDVRPQLLAWCKGVKTEDPARLAAAYEALRKPRDFAALYSLCQHIVLTGSKLKARAQRCMEAIDRLARKHVDRIRISEKYRAAPSLGHAPAFLESFRGVPAREQFEGKWRELRLEHALAAQPYLAMYEAQRYLDLTKAFNAGVVAIHRGYLDPRCYSTPLHDHLERFRKSGNPRLEKRDVRFWEAHRKAHADGIRDFLALNAKFKAP